MGKKKEKKRRKDEKNEKTYLGPSSWYSQIAAGVMSSLQLKNMLINEINNIYIYNVTCTLGPDDARRVVWARFCCHRPPRPSKSLLSIDRT